jgi:tetratricopeptide (TPR) repeat protein
VIYLNRGNVYLTKLEYDRAHADYDTAIALNPSDPNLYHAKGLAY